jgi:glycosyltransferase involved in cell wall biosynthesis
MSQTHNTKVPPQICILSGVHDDVYRSTRSDDPVLCTSAGKRKLLYQAIAEASGASPLILSPHPRGRGVPSALPETTSQFAGCRQIFARACGIRKVRYFIDFIHYARHVFRHTNRDSILIIDNYELIYLIAIYYCRMLGRRNPLLLDYEDGKHLIDKGIWRIMSGLAETLGKPLVKGALLATPNLASRLSGFIPKVVIPGILHDGIVFNPPPAPGEPVSILYSGSLDNERGIPLLIDYLEQGDLPPNVVFHITGQGMFSERLCELQKAHRYSIIFHATVSQERLAEIRSICHYGLNLQTSANPISDVTYPSKTFDYLNAGIRLISTRAAGAEKVLGETAIYLDEESPASLRRAILIAIDTLHSESSFDAINLLNHYSYPGTVKRIKEMLDSTGLQHTFKIYRETEALP